MEPLKKFAGWQTLPLLSTREHKTEHNYTLVNQAINIRKSNKGVTKEIEHISNNNNQRFKERQTQDRKLNKQKIQLNYNKDHYTKQKKQQKVNNIKGKNQLNDNKHDVGQLSTPVLDLLKVFYDTRSNNKNLEHSTHTLKVTKSNNSNINTIKQSTKHRQQTSKLHTKKVNENIQPTVDE